MYIDFPITANGDNIALGASTVNNSVALPRTFRAGQARISVPPSAVDVWIAFGIGSAATVTIPTNGGGVANGMHYPTGCVEVVTIPSGATHVSCITATGTTTLYILQSQGR